MSEPSNKKLSTLAVISAVFIILGFLAIPFNETMYSILSRVYVIGHVYHKVLRIALGMGLLRYAVAFTFWFTASLFALTSLILIRFNPVKQKRYAFPLACLIVSLLSIIAFSVPFPKYDNTYAIQRDKTFGGDSEKLIQTVIVPTLKSPMPEGKNVIWCSSFQLTWNELKNDIIKEPIKLEKNQELADLLNQAKQTKQDVSEKDYYARAGFVKDNIIQTIQAEMAQKFPEEPIPSFDDVKEKIIIVSYSFLSANVRFTLPYFENDKELQFTDSIGNKTAISSFGLRDKDTSKYKKLRDQIQILFAKQNLEYQLTECAIDLCKDSSPNLIVIAMVEPKETLSETLTYIDKQCQKAASKKSFYEFRPNEFNWNDTLLIPNLFWRIDHSYKELEADTLQNPGYEGAPIEKATQIVQFRLDRSGAALKSEAVLLVGGGAANYVFDRPFLVYMKKRDAEHPFFVMWVDNAELLEKY